MAGYQRHNFDTTYVQPQSDGGWGALARGFSNGYSMGKAIASSINQHNVSEANKEYDKAVENANTQTMKPEQAIDPELVKAGTPERTRVLSQSQMDNLSPEGEKYFEDFYAKQSAAGNTPEYKYDAGQRAQMVQQAGEVKDKAIRDSYLQYMGQDAYDDYKLKQSQVKEADYKGRLIDMRNNFRDKISLYGSGTPEGNQALLEAAQARGLVDPKGQYDLKNMTMTTIGPNGKPVVAPITPQMIAGVKDQVELGMLRELYADDPTQRLNIDTYDSKVEAARLAPSEIRSKINSNNASADYKRIAGRELTKNGDFSRGLKLAEATAPIIAGAAKNGGSSGGQAKWQKDSFEIGGVPFITRTAQGDLVPRLDGEGTYSPEEVVNLTSQLDQAGIPVQVATIDGVRIPVINFNGATFPLSHGEALLANLQRENKQKKKQAINTQGK
ncbi:hypothetical protein [Turicimonas muris]|uniref:hypothetical protein n=1 Tax=Turicimonas muris TaxID=1796652 RepID=UPI0023F4BA09|nr:hypothetical protein [Turicimonas muris]